MGNSDENHSSKITTLLNLVSVNSLIKTVLGYNAFGFSLDIKVTRLRYAIKVPEQGRVVDMFLRPF